MNKAIKVMSVLIIVAMVVMAISSVCYATTPGDIQPGTGAGLGDLNTKAQNVLGTIRNIAAVASVILVAILGIKFMLGSTEEKAEYKKSFIPLIVGMLVVLLATSIADFIWNMFA